MRRLMIGSTMLVALTLWSMASAGHDHYLANPAVCVQIAAGNTGSTAGQPAYHQFHWRVHKGGGAVNGVMEASGTVGVYLACPS
jgi:hypothetical protein